jgi:hypothetical protein
MRAAEDPRLVFPPSRTDATKAPYTVDEVHAFLDAATRPDAPDALTVALGMGLSSGVVIPDAYETTGRKPAGPFADLALGQAATLTPGGWTRARLWVARQPQLPDLCHRRLERTWLSFLLQEPDTCVLDLMNTHDLRRKRLNSVAGHLEVDSTRYHPALRGADRLAHCGTDLVVPDEEVDMPKRKSAAAARRARAALLTEQPEPLPEPLEHKLQTYQPRPKHIRAVWPTVRPIVITIMRRSHVRGKESFRDHIVALTKFAVWAHNQDIELTIPSLMRHSLIEDWVRSGDAGNVGNTISTRRWRLRALASHVNPGPDAPPDPRAIRHVSIKPPYDPTEVAAIIRIATTQPSPRVSRQLCAAVGLGLGAGLDAQDFNDLRTQHIEDRGDDGIIVKVPGPHGRSVPVRRRYEDLVRRGLDGVQPGHLIVGSRTNRRRATNIVYQQAVALGAAPEMLQSRMRTTWLADLMVNPVPLAAILTAAGLKSARTLTEIAGMIDVQLDGDSLRGTDR